MIIETGHFALLLALAVAAYQMVVPLYAATRGDERLMRVAASSAVMQFLLLCLSFAVLTWAYVTSDFSVLNVWANSHSAKPMIYKISGVWGNHEGSMLLWVLILALFSAAVAAFGTNLPPGLKARVLSVQGSISFAFLSFIVLVSNPFQRLDQVPAQGKGLNPILQDPALAIHPPLLYGGYVGLSVAFSFAIAALIEGRVDAAWARWVRPWTLAAWMFLTAGISMGSWWAYYELGWGGWWFWDPVENASFMPWLIATALLHSAIVVEKRNSLKVWTILLAILAFSLSLIGTFIVRSGLLTSVHAFAVDPERGVFILLILCFFIGGALALYAWRAPQLKAGGLFSPISREGALVVNNLLLTAGAAAVFIGTLYPLVLEAITGNKISVGPPYFNFTFGILILPLLVLVPLGPMLSWKRADVWAATQRLWLAGAIALVATLIPVIAQVRGPWLAPLGIGLGMWLIAGSLVELAGRIKLFQAPVTTSLARLKGLPGQAIGMMLAHLGVGVMVLGVVAVTAWRVEVGVAMKPGDVVEVAGTRITYVGESPHTGPNYSATVGRFKVESGNRPVAELTSEKRIFLPSRQPTTEVGIYSFWTGDLYISMGDEALGGGRNVRAYFNPLVTLIWFGTVIMFIGGGISLMDRRYRIGAPKRAATVAVPAE
ncbi:MAG: heme lyase CcmF/NrfE family subunit [Rhizobiales bacterium]|nr:heme lyase CcmF/NrfE family subunit [Hyphomicrobiales bacterium]